MQVQSKAAARAIPPSHPAQYSIYSAVWTCYSAHLHREKASEPRPLYCQALSVSFPATDRQALFLPLHISWRFVGRYDISSYFCIAHSFLAVTPNVHPLFSLHSHTPSALFNRHQHP